uniref:OSJNBb0080H08.14 protein n=1 Tax=Oryza sativa subsp. japonica TaxID=39947 RepID=Q7XXJ8_ORYSJ|nr:OSJNBb0080H08.14 [Oryza sativa Japonica Group]
MATETQERHWSGDGGVRVRAGAAAAAAEIETAVEGEELSILLHLAPFLLYFVGGKWSFFNILTREFANPKDDDEELCFEMNEAENFIIEDMSRERMVVDVSTDSDDFDGSFDLEDMLRHVKPEVLAGRSRGLENWQALEKASKDLLYDETKGCDKDFTVLRSVLELLRLKAKHGWSDTSFNDLMSLLRVLLPKPNFVPSNTYQAKKLICPLSLGVEKIHACKNHCILYRKEYAELECCPTCGTSRYKMGNGPVDSECTDPDSDKGKRGKIPSMVMWYLPIKDRLKRLYSNPTDAELMRWHQESQKIDGMIRHPADARQWKTFDAKHPEFAKDPRNKRKYILLTILIQGPNQPGIDIDVFLEPLMEDMEELWKEGLRLWDEFKREHFNLRAIIFVTINDLPANFSLSGQIKGKTGCLICLEKTSYRYLTSSLKTVYMRHRRFLPQRHRYRKMARLFDNTVENDTAPVARGGTYVYEITKKINVVYGKGKKKTVKRKKADGDNGTASPFKKHSIFFKYLDYRKDLEIRHAIDVMHLEKNVFDSTVGTLLDIPSKTKDGLKSRNNLVYLSIRHDLHPVVLPNGKTEIPPACYSLTLEEKKAFSKCLQGVRVPTGFTSNIRKLVSMKDLTISGYNAHDCHRLLTVFLPIAIRAVKPVHTKVVITKLCYFFNRISQKMWAYERYMSILKGYVRNRAHPEGSLIEEYTTEEAVECCMDYIKDANAIGIPVHRHEGRLSGRGTVGRKQFFNNDYKKVSAAHNSVLQQLAIVEPFIERHLEEIKACFPGRSNDWISREHKRRFPPWLKDLNLPVGDSVEELTLQRLACGPSSIVNSWQGYDINGFTLSTTTKDMKSTAQNSRIRVEAIDTSGEKRSYYGTIQEIRELDYGLNIQIPVLRCEWVKDTIGVSVDDYGLTIVDHSKTGHKDDPWVLAERVAQVFYVKDPSDERKTIVISGKQQIVGIDNIEDPNDYNQFDDVPLFTDLPMRIKKVERTIDEANMSYVRADGVAKVIKS